MVCICCTSFGCVQNPTELVFLTNSIPSVRGNRIHRSMRGSGMRMSTKLPVDMVLPHEDRYTSFFYRGRSVVAG